MNDQPTIPRSWRAARDPGGRGAGQGRGVAERAQGGCWPPSPMISSASPSLANAVPAKLSAGQMVSIGWRPSA